MSLLDSWRSCRLEIKEKERIKLVKSDFVLVKKLHEPRIHAERFQVELATGEVQGIDHESDHLVTQVELVATLRGDQLGSTERTHERGGVPTDDVAINVCLEIAKQTLRYLTKAINNILLKIGAVYLLEITFRTGHRVGKSNLHSVIIDISQELTSNIGRG